MKKKTREKHWNPIFGDILKFSHWLKLNLSLQNTHVYSLTLLNVFVLCFCIMFCMFIDIETALENAKLSVLDQLQLQILFSSSDLR